MIYGGAFCRPFRAWKSCGWLTQGVARRLAWPRAIFFRAFSPSQSANRTLAEEITLAGKFFVPKEQKVTNPGQEQLLLHATVEELVRHDLALRENADDGRYLVFPSQFNRDYEDAPEPKGKAVAITFDGPVQSLYSTLAVRLGHSGLFTTGRAEMWRNVAVFTARAGGKCGLFLHEFTEGRGRLILKPEVQTAKHAKFAKDELSQQKPPSSRLRWFRRHSVLFSRGSRGSR